MPLPGVLPFAKSSLHSGRQVRIVHNISSVGAESSQQDEEALTVEAADEPAMVPPAPHDDFVFFSRM